MTYLTPEYCDCYCHDHIINDFYNEGKYCSQCSEHCNLKYTKDQRWERSSIHLMIGLAIGFSALGGIVGFATQNIIIGLVGAWPGILGIGFGIYKTLQERKKYQV